MRESPEETQGRHPAPPALLIFRNRLSRSMVFSLLSSIGLHFFFLPFCFWHDINWMNPFLVAISTFKWPLVANRNRMWTWSLLPQLGMGLGMGLLTETNCNFNWNESLWGSRIAQWHHVEQSSAIKLLRALVINQLYCMLHSHRGTLP